MESINFSYVFSFEDRSVEKTVSIDAETMELILPDGYQPSSWVELENNKCHHCPLSSKDHKYCPAAKNLDHVAKDFSDLVSFQELTIEVRSERRVFKADTSLQVGLKGLLGLAMATSRCPHLSILKPMARFHLPFANNEETLVRTLAFFMLGEYFKKRKERNSTIMLSDLKESYQDIMDVNRGIAERIRSVDRGDARINSLVCLDSFAQSLRARLSSDMDDVADLFDIAS